MIDQTESDLWQNQIENYVTNRIGLVYIKIKTEL